MLQLIIPITIVGLLIIYIFFNNKNIQPTTVVTSKNINTSSITLGTGTTSAGTTRAGTTSAGTTSAGTTRAGTTRAGTTRAYTNISNYIMFGSGISADVPVYKNCIFLKTDGSVVFLIIHDGLFKVAVSYQDNNNFYNYSKPINANIVDKLTNTRDTLDMHFPSINTITTINNSLTSNFLIADGFVYQGISTINNYSIKLTSSITYETNVSRFVMYGPWITVDIPILNNCIINKPDGSIVYLCIHRDSFKICVKYQNDLKFYNYYKSVNISIVYQIINRLDTINKYFPSINIITTGTTAATGNRFLLSDNFISTSSPTDVYVVRELSI